MDDYEKYEKDCKTIRKANERLLDDFEDYLTSSGLSEKTIAKHLLNIDFYINHFLLYDDTREAKDGAYAIDKFLGYWFIRKAMWANRSSIKGNAASLKKFYTFMYEKGLIEIEDLAELKRTIKTGMSDWFAAVKRYDDLADDFSW